MIKFDVEKMRSVYVHIVKITSGYVYVTNHRNGEVYNPKGSNRFAYQDFTVTRVPIDGTVYALYKRYSSMTSFSRPRLASLNFYGDTIVSIETQQYSKRLGGFQDAANWKSYFSRALPDLRGLTNNREGFIDGVDIFWFEDETSSYNLDDDGCFSMMSCKAVSLGNLGRPLTFKSAQTLENKAAASGDDDMLNQIDNFYHLRTRTGVVLRYRPEAGTSKAQGDELVTVYSSVLAEIKGFTRGHGQSESREDKESKNMVRALYEMCHKTSPSQANLSFLLSSAKTIGKLYGMQEAHFLNVPMVMKATGQMTLVDIPEKQRGMIPIGRSAQEALGWLFRFIYMEDNLSNMRHLIKTMKICLTKGLMPLSEDSLIKEAWRGKEIPMVNLEEARKKPLTNLDRLITASKTTVQPPVAA